MNYRNALLFVVALIVCVPALAFAAPDVTLTSDGKVPGGPFEYLQSQIDDIELIKGDTGDQGIQGVKGDKGDTGATGATGPKGDTGDTGLTGATGATGPKGDKGDKGDTGATGAKGDKGDQGIQGVAGNDGAKGDQGIQGVAGNDGANGEQGIQGVAGNDGAKGDTGDTGATGPAGADGVGPWTVYGGTVSTTTSIQIGDETIGCGSTTAGTIRFTGTGFEGCDGTNWVSLSTRGLGDLRYAIGDTGPAGGIVFYIINRGLNGLEAARVDQATNVTWGCSGQYLSAPDGTAVGTGAQNTVDIQEKCTATGIAAQIADVYTLNGYDDWFLPSKGELHELYLQKAVVPFLNGLYWSSSESGPSKAWGEHINDWADGHVVEVYKYGACRVRAVRAF